VVSHLALLGVGAVTRTPEQASSLHSIFIGYQLVPLDFNYLAFGCTSYSLKVWLGFRCGIYSKRIASSQQSSFEYGSIKLLRTFGFVMCDTSKYYF
jgi:hypothetical protein